MKKGFTLIELLVVIAIIAILAAILFPVFMSAKEKGRQAACTSHMRQIGAALQQYIDDSNGTIPPAQFYASGVVMQGVAVTYMGTLENYVKNLSVWHCPSMRPEEGYYGKSVVKNNVWRPAAAIWQEYPATYAPAVADDYGTGGVVPRSSPPWNQTDTRCKQSELRNPARKILLAHDVWPMGQFLARYSPFWSSAEYGIVAGRSITLHKGASVYIFGDCHARYLDWNTTRSMWNRDGSPLYGFKTWPP